ncbi:unnamed protein product [Caenorhabditis bovis]|uniref:Uncharacterized protein n=1 Tax=Caenorhabditis bovis TaxID=2654633 RepID=A0A8S1EN97_9PELO|nr:unnamed protein product [Caenorhabditis bovis]
MPLEVSARLDREKAIYLAGETIQVTVTIKNISTKGKQVEQLAWGSVQFACERTMGASTSSSIRQRPTTAMTRSASTVYSSPPNIMFCELKLAPGQEKKFICDIHLSRNLIPPTYRGFHIKYSSRLTIAVSHIQSHINLRHIQIRIIPSVGLETKLSLPSNPFLASTMTRPTIVETVMATVDELTMSRKSQAFALTHATSKVALLTLPKKAYRLGEDVCAYLDFSDSNTPCIQYSATIETEEKIIDAHVGEETNKKTSVKVHDQTAPVCTFSPDSTFRLSIPLTAVPTFSTDSVQLKWRIRFIFVVTDQPYKLRVENGVPVSNVPVESFSWSTEILVLPCKPQNVALLDHSFPNNTSLTV